MFQSCSFRLGLPHESSSLSNLLIVRPRPSSILFFLIPLPSFSSSSFLNFLIVSPRLSLIFPFLFVLLIQSSPMEVLRQSTLEQWKSNIPGFLGNRDFRRLIGIEGKLEVGEDDQRFCRLRSRVGRFW
jgi:hypothetical protein